jgi:UDP-N-acetylmuramoyl-tripeptide--D-alanyl-D-alanine ligase
VRRSLAAFAGACGGVLHGEDRAYAAVSTDTRSLGAGDLFIALRGPNFDGNSFAAAAAAAGAAGAVVDRLTPGAGPQIAVADPQAALAAGARAWRAGFSLPLVGVAGSNGKTTTKEMVAAILAEAGATLATRGNLNNHIGVPLTLLRLEPGHRFAVVEIGANRAGEVAELAALARPSIGLVTNAGAEHLEGFGSLEGVAAAEGELFASLPADGVAVINADDAFAPLWRAMTRASPCTFGVEQAADFRATGVTTEVGAAGFTTRFTLHAPQGAVEVTLPLAGRHNVLNALGAAAAAVAAGASGAQVVSGLARVPAARGRLQFRLARNGAWIIDDSYNANPSSMRAGIEVLGSLGGRRWLVVGDMAELGAFAESSHVELGELAREHGIERLFATGRLAALAVESFGPGGEWHPDTEQLGAALRAALPPEARVLVKGSRMNRLERVVATLVDA